MKVWIINGYTSKNGKLSIEVFKVFRDKEEAYAAFNERVNNYEGNIVTFGNKAKCYEDGTEFWIEEHEL